VIGEADCVRVPGLDQIVKRIAWVLLNV
jgi:hypothetical protein